MFHRTVQLNQSSVQVGWIENIKLSMMKLDYWLSYCDIKKKKNILTSVELDCWMVMKQMEKCSRPNMEASSTSKLPL